MVIHYLILFDILYSLHFGWYLAVLRLMSYRQFVIAISMGVDGIKSDKYSLDIDMKT